MKKSILSTAIIVVFALAACGQPQIFGAPPPETATPTPEALVLVVPDNPDAPSSSEATRVSMLDQIPERSMPRPAVTPVEVGARGFMALSHDESLLAVIQTSTMCMFRADTLEVLWCAPSEDVTVPFTSVPVWSPDDRLVAAYSFASVTLWDALTGRIRTVTPSGSQAGEFINGMSWEACDNPALVSFSSGSVGLLDPVTNSYSDYLKISDQGLIDTRTSGCGAPMVALDQSGSLALVDPESGRSLSRLDGVATFPEWSPDDKRLVVGRGMDLLMVTPGQDMLSASVFGHAPSNIQSIVWSRDGGSLAVVDGTGATLWDVKAENPTYRFVGPITIRGATFNHDGTMLVLIDQEKTMSVWDVSSGRLLIQTTDVQNIVFSSETPGQALMFSAGVISLVDLR